jgi:N-carbamoylputrescine amidase
MPRVTVCELPDFESERFDSRFGALLDHVAERDADLVVLPELPFAPWWPARDPADHDRDAEWRAAAERHREWLARLDRLDAVALTSRPVVREGQRYNEAVLRVDGATQPVRPKAYLPDEPGFREASWYAAGPGEFDPVGAAGLDLGPLVCTDLWASQEVRRYGRAGVELLVNPRVTERRTTEKWLAGARTMGVLAGAYLASSNRSGAAAGVTFGGAGWVTSPDGTVLARTDDDNPVVTVDVDPAVAERAAETYPRDALRRAETATATDTDD